MSKPGGDPSSGISLGDALILPKRHPACRRREAQLGSCTERENLSLRCQGRHPSGAHHEDQSTDAEPRDGAARSRDEGKISLQAAKRSVSALHNARVSSDRIRRKNEQLKREGAAKIEPAPVEVVRRRLNTPPCGVPAVRGIEICSHSRHGRKRDRDYGAFWLGLSNQNPAYVSEWRLRGCPNHAAGRSVFCVRYGSRTSRG